jgi:hypothetical protein
MNDSAAGDLLGEVHKQQTRVRRRIDGTWFHLLFVGIALVIATALATLVDSDVAKVGVYALCLAPYYFAVFRRNRRAVDEFGVRFEANRKWDLISYTGAGAAVLAGVLVRGDGGIVAALGIASIVPLVLAVATRSWILAAIAAVDLAAAGVSAVTSDGGYLPATLVICGGLALIGLVSLVQVQHGGGDR